MATVGVGILLAAAWLALIVVSRIDELFLPGQGISNLPSLPGVDPDGAAEGQINFLVMGLDRRPSEGDAPTRTDTMFIVTVDSETKTAGILGIPRDSWVDIPLRDSDGFYQSRVNTVYATGERQGYAGGGPALVKEVVELATGIPIDYYVVIDFEGFVDIIDELGGVDVFVEREVNDPFYSRTELPGDYTPLHFEVGTQHMDGETALDYSRTRYGSSDLDRIQRQQQVIFAAIDKALERRIVSVDSLTGLWGRYKNTIDTDINDLRAPGFASLAAQIDPARITALSLGVASVAFTTPAGEQVLLIDKEIVQELVGALFSDQLLLQEDASVEIQSGTDAGGLAADVVSYLDGAGFPSDALTAATTVDGDIQPFTEIIDFSGKEHTIERLVELLAIPSDQVRVGEDGDRALSTVAGADVVVILGADLQARDFVTDAQGG